MFVHLLGSNSNRPVESARWRKISPLSSGSAALQLESTAVSPSPAENLRLPASRFVSGVTAAYMDGRHQDLLAPLELRMPGSNLALTARPGQRAGLAEELAQANTSYGHPRAAELAVKLADPATVIVVTGQQAGLFGGPLFSLTKMMGAAKWAADLEAQGIPAVGVLGSDRGPRLQRDRQLCSATVQS